MARHPDRVEFARIVSMRPDCGRKWDRESPVLIAAGVATECQRYFYSCSRCHGRPESVAPMRNDGCGCVSPSLIRSVAGNRSSLSTSSNSAEQVILLDDGRILKPPPNKIVDKR